MAPSITAIPKTGDIAFVHYFEEGHAGVVPKPVKGSPFKATITAVVYTTEAIRYTVRHVTDDFQHPAYIADFVAMADGSYPRMKQIAKTDARLHKAWLSSVLDEA